jgi:hypothetical protein
MTAAHVGGQLGERRSVDFGGRSVPGKWVKVGAFEQTDISILELDDVVLPNGFRSLRPLRLCDKPVRVGQSVLVVSPGNVSPARMLHVVYNGTVQNVSKYSLLVGDPETTGNSGSGVFDANERCLLGIVSAKITAHFQFVRNGETSTESKVIGKYFVPASEIRTFLNSLPTLQKLLR